MAEGSRHERASLAARKGWETRRARMSAEIPQQEREPSWVTRLTRPLRMGLGRVAMLGMMFNPGVAGDDVNVSTIVSQVSRPMVIARETGAKNRPLINRQTEVDPVTLERAKAVGKYQGLIEQMAEKTVLKALAVLDQEPSSEAVFKEAIKLIIQHGFEMEANKTQAELGSGEFDQAVNEPDFQQKITEKAVKLASSLEKTTSDLPTPDSSLALLGQLYHILKDQKNMSSLVKELMKFTNEGDKEAMIQMREIAYVISKNSKLTDLEVVSRILAQYYDNQVGGTVVLRVIAGNIVFEV